MKDWTDRVIAISVSDSQELGPFGFMEAEDLRFLGAILTPLIFRGARIAYGGRIAPPSETNFTAEINMQLAAPYREGGGTVGARPYIHYLRDNDARHEGPERLFAHALRLGSFSEIKLLRRDVTCATLLPSGRIVDVYAGAPARKANPLGAARSASDLMTFGAVAEIFSGATGRNELADMRQAMARETHARVIVGGRFARTSDGASGVADEALRTLEAAKPLLPLGGLGGASRDVAAMLGLLGETERVQRDEAAYRDVQGKPSMARYWSHMEKLRAFQPDYSRKLASSGLLNDARRLARSDTYAEISALVVTLLDALIGHDRPSAA